MKKGCIWMLLLLAVSSSLCAKAIYGEGVVKEDVRKLPKFSKLVTGGPLHVLFSDIDDEIVKIKAESNLLQYIRSKVDNGILYLELASDVKPTQPIHVYLGVKELTDISVYGPAQIENKNELRTDSLTLRVSGTAQVTFSGLFCDQFELELEGFGTVHVKGSAQKQSVVINGASIYQALELISEDVSIKLSGASKAWVYAKNHLSATLSGAAYLGYEGNPTVEKTVSGAAVIEKLSPEQISYPPPSAS